MKKRSLCLGLMLVFSIFTGTLVSADIVKKPIIILNENRDFTHTVFGEFGTATWCGYCKYAHGALIELYGEGQLDFFYVTMVADKNTNANTRCGEYNLYGYPTLWWDGGYEVDVGAGSVESAKTAYTSSINTCGSRSVNNIDLFLDVDWMGPNNPIPEDSGEDVQVDAELSWTDSEMDISVSIDNNEGSTYGGTLRVYVNEVETSMGWIDSGGVPYTFPFLDYAWNEDIEISSGSSWDDSTTWNGKDYDDGYGNDFGGITQDNTMVIAAVFDDEWHQGYSNPPNGNPFNAYYVDATAGCLAGVDTDPKSYDVYFGTSSSPPKVEGNQSELTYDPGNLDFETEYFWKIVAWDDLGSSISSPIWSFTTRGNEAPNEPSDPEPEDGATDVAINQDCSWTGGDPDNDTVTYDVYFGDSNPPPKVKSNQTSTSYNTGVLDFETEYFWKIVAWDEFSYSSTGPTWSFTTQENLPPEPPSDPDPEDGATDVSIEKMLRWTGYDPNPGDQLTFDVYFGTTNPPDLVAEDINQDAYDPGTMDLSTIYYWQIITTDSQGLSKTGEIWSFTTELEPNNEPNAPDISGETNGKNGKEYDYIFSAKDPENNEVYLWIDWGDGNVEEWLGPYDSEEEITLSHAWEEEGKYTIKAKAKDVKEAEGDWGYLQVSMPFNKAFNMYKIILKALFERFSNLFAFLQYLLKLS